MSGERHDDPVAEVDALVAGIGPELDAPAVHRRDVVLVTGPWMAGVSAVAAVLRERLPEHKFVESAELGPGEVPMAVVFVVSAAAQLTPSDCALLDAAAAHTDVVVPVVSKIDVHRAWRDVLAANRASLAAHAPRYGGVHWVGAAALPDLGEPDVDELVETLATRLANPELARRNRLRAWEFRLKTVAQRFDRDADGAGRRARVDALRGERSTALRRRREAKTERAITLRGQIQQARVQLSHFARNRCSSVRSELQEDVAGLSRRNMPGFEAHTRGRLGEVIAEVNEGTATHLADVAQVVGVATTLPSLEELPTVDVPAPPLKSRRHETWLLMLLGAGFGLGVALTLSRLMSGLATRISPALSVVAAVTCVAIGLAVTLLVINIRSLLRDRALLDRWAGEVTSSLRSVAEELVATRVLVAESVLSKAVLAQDEVENAAVSDQVNAIDRELRAHAAAASRAAAARDREMPTVLAALDVVRAELGESGIPRSDGPLPDVRQDAENQATEKPASRSGDGDSQGSSESLL
ncbi:hypothetical protein [Mycobacterium paraseoulense]|uniref:Uncharacterized protein n=1 Tax=Mycobacterium paraseoulense TaxID=590652 RepID=A0A1X0I4F4_9MYCO|nr:hypothetical protein [Mycobacterium paraseoulense]MCV7396469.1 hypothetical protein [Mycobacterium paraseoulense]ORB34656.1 hypothetical protein BST39_23970 [Mycobacterium paraseoulense]BBZ73019.1 hypothetical protein MPRS_41120 [Mycobacterium paraseoulense]